MFRRNRRHWSVLLRDREGSREIETDISTALQQRVVLYNG